VANNKINDDKKCMQISGDFDCHANAVVQCGAYCPMEHIQGFSISHWMPPLGKCLCRINLAAAMVDNFGCKKKSLTKHNFLLTNLR
jgi:hypothetical protein